MIDYGQIRLALPHGPPMVLVDRVDWVEPGRALHAVKAVSGTEACYRDLPPGLPREHYAYPVSLIIESFGQAALLLWRSAADPGGWDDLNPVTPMLAAIRDCQIEGAAYPGDVLRHEVRFERSVAGAGFAAGQTWAGARRIATIGSIIAVLRPAVHG